MSLKNHLSEKIGYGLGDTASSMFWKIFSYYLPFFYSNVFGLTLADAGLLLLITKVYDAVSDPIMGIIADRTNSRWGKYRPYLLWMAAPFALIGILTFVTPSFDSYNLKLAWAYICYILMMTAYTAINVPYGALLGVVSPDSKEKTQFSSFRMFFAYGGSFIALALFEPLLDFFSSHTNQQASWTASMGVIGAICCILFIFCFLLTRERVTVSQKETGNSLSDDIKALLSNRPWWVLLCVAIGTLLFNSIRGGVAAYYFKDFLSDNAIFSCGFYLAAGEIANMAGVVCAVPLAARYGKKNACIYALIAICIFSTCAYWLPATRTGMYLLFTVQVLASCAAGVILPLLWSMFADIADYSEYKRGVCSTGLIFSSSSMAQKFGGAFGSALLLWILSVIGYDTAENSIQSAETLTGLRAMISWIPALGAGISLIAITFYPLTDKMMKDIQRVLRPNHEA